MTGTIWLCLAEGDEHGPRIRAWTTDPKRAGQLRADGLDMVEYRCLAAMTHSPREVLEADSTLYLERFAVRKILTGQPEENLYITEGVLADVDELPIFTKADLALTAAALDGGTCV